MLELNTEEVKLLKKVLKYVIDSEEKHYNEMPIGAKRDQHICHDAMILNTIVQLKSELPPVFLSGDTSLDSFKNGS